MFAEIETKYIFARPNKQELWKGHFNHLEEKEVISTDFVAEWLQQTDATLLHLEELKEEKNLLYLTKERIRSKV